jgi:1-deoxy-D-xylulose-5-phosphate reductoisomerase
MGKLGGSPTVCMNAANEESVFAFLDGKISLGDIYKITEKMTQNHNVIKNPSIDEIFEIDNEVRIKTKELIK